MKKPFEITVMINPMDDAGKWVVYNLLDSTTAEIIFVGHIELDHLFTLSDLNKNVAFDRSKNYIFNLVSLHPDKRDAGNAHHRYVQSLPRLPHLNRMATFGRHGNILCDQTGEVFLNQRAAAQAHGIDAGALGRHLSGKPYHKSVKGRTYRFTTNPATVTPEPRNFKPIGKI